MSNGRDLWNSTHPSDKDLNRRDYDKIEKTDSHVQHWEDPKNEKNYARD